MNAALRLLGLVLLPTIGLAVAFGIAPDRVTLEVHVWLLVVLGLLLVASIGIVQRAFPAGPSPFLASLRRPVVSSARPDSLLKAEREVSMAGSSAFDVHRRLRPSLVELSRDLLAVRRGIDLDRSPDDARVVLGEDAWELVRPDRPEPEARHGAGIRPDELERVVVALEEI